MPKTEIRLDKKLLIAILTSLFFSFLLLFAIEHYGKFKYEYNQTKRQLGPGIYELSHDFDTRLTGIIYITPFQTVVRTSGKGYNLGDVQFSHKEWNNDYSLKLEYYWKAFKKDMSFGFLIAAVCIFLYIVFTKVKIKLT